MDPWPGPRAVADALAVAMAELGCDLLVALDVGGDALAHGDEPGLGSPLCDAVMLAAADRLAAGGPAGAGRGVRGRMRRRAHPRGDAWSAWARWPRRAAWPGCGG